MLLYACTLQVNTVYWFLFAVKKFYVFRGLLGNCETLLANFCDNLFKHCVIQQPWCDSHEVCRLLWYILFVHQLLEVGITIKSTETSSKLASYPAMKSLATHSTSCTGYYLYLFIQNSTRFNPYFGSIIIGNTNYKSQSRD